MGLRHVNLSEGRCGRLEVKEEELTSYSGQIKPVGDSTDVTRHIC